VTPCFSLFSTTKGLNRLYNETIYREAASTVEISPTGRGPCKSKEDRQQQPSASRHSLPPEKSDYWNVVAPVGSLATCTEVGVAGVAEDRTSDASHGTWPLSERLKLTYLSYAFVCK
jgi:hypothetical protein